jgi:predicted nuclease of predicted toxin-antitoxin system
MRLLADENIPLLAIEQLRRKGHDVLAISESAPSICDEDVMLLAENEGRILLTFDKDFGELAYSSRPRPSCGIILFRIPLRSANYIAKIIAEVLDSRCD